MIETLVMVAVVFILFGAVYPVFSILIYPFYMFFGGSFHEEKR